MRSGSKGPGGGRCCLIFFLVLTGGACVPAPDTAGAPGHELSASVELPGAPSYRANGQEDSWSNPYLPRARELAGALSDRALAGQLIMTGVDGAGRIPGPSRRLLEDILPGAVLLFGYNIPSDPLDLALLWDELRQMVPIHEPMPFIAIDHEGGSVFRFRSGLTRLPSARAMAKGGVKAASLAGRIAGSELAVLGISMNLAPIFEVLDEHNAAFLDSRAWSEDGAEAAALAAAFAVSCQAEGVAAVGKHFPGNVALDPHRGLPVLDVDFEELETRYLQNFAVAVRHRVAAIMLSHILIPAVDPEFPVSLSPAAIDLLRHRLGFDGIIMSDDLAMSAISGIQSLETGALMALRSGVDMVMVSGTRQALKVRDAILQALEEGQLDREAVLESVARIIAQKLRFALFRNEPDERELGREGLKALVHKNQVALDTLLRR